MSTYPDTYPTYPEEEHFEEIEERPLPPPHVTEHYIVQDVIGEGAYGVVA